MYGGWCIIEIWALRPIVPRAIAIASAIEPAVSHPMISGTVALSAPTTITRLTFSRPRWPHAAGAAAADRAAAPTPASSFAT